MRGCTWPDMQPGSTATTAPTSAADVSAGFAASACDGASFTVGGGSAAAVETVSSTSVYCQMEQGLTLLEEGLAVLQHKRRNQTPGAALANQLESTAQFLPRLEAIIATVHSLT